MKIKVNYPEQFATWGNAIGIILYSREQDSFVNFFTGDMEHSRVERKELGSPSLVELLIELENNSELRFVAKQNQLITVTEQHTIDFLEYANSYN
tara:strand:- start:136 stop:420 length:285 start_codon:yes stop_codon:yes gene_type:complete